MASSVQRNYNFPNSKLSKREHQNEMFKTRLACLKSLVAHKSFDALSSCDKTTYRGCLYQTLRDGNWMLKVQCLDILDNIIKTLGRKVDQDFPGLCGQVVEILGDRNDILRKKSASILSVLFDETGDRRNFVKAYVQRGIENEDLYVRKNCLIMIPVIFNEQAEKKLEKLVCSLAKIIIDTESPLFRLVLDSLQYLQNLLGDKLFYFFLTKAYVNADHLYQNMLAIYCQTNVEQAFNDAEWNEVCDANSVQCDIFDETFMGKVYSDKWRSRVDAALQIGKVVKQIDNVESVDLCLNRILGILAILNQDVNSRVVMATLHAIESVLHFFKDKDLNRYLRPLVTLLMNHMGCDKAIRQKTIKIVHNMLSQVPPMQMLRIILEDWKTKNAKTREEIMNRVAAALLTNPKAKYDMEFLIKNCVQGLSDENNLVKMASFESALILHKCSMKDHQKLLAMLIRQCPVSDSLEILLQFRKRLEDKLFATCSSDGLVHCDSRLSLKTSSEQDNESHAFTIPKDRGEGSSPQSNFRELSSVNEDVETFGASTDSSARFSTQGDVPVPESPAQSVVSDRCVSSETIQSKRKAPTESGSLRVEKNVIPSTPEQPPTSDSEIYHNAHEDLPMQEKPRAEFSDSELSVGSNGTFAVHQEVQKPEESVEKSFLDESEIFPKKRLISVLERWENAYAGRDSCEMEPLLNPHQTIQSAFAALCQLFDTQKDWYKRKEAMNNLFRVAKHHPHILFEHRRVALITVCHHVRKVPIVARAALKTMREIIGTLGCFSDQEAELVMSTLLDEYGITQYKNMKDEIVATLADVIGKISYQRAAVILTSMRKHTKSKKSVELEAKLLREIVVELGSHDCLVEENNMAANILLAAGFFVKNPSPVTRYYGRRIIQVLMTSLEFDKFLRRHVPRRTCDDIREAVVDIKKKGVGKSPQPKQRPIKKPKPRQCLTTQVNYKAASSR